MNDKFSLESFQINQELVLIQMEANSVTEVITQLSAILLERGYVKSSYAEAAIAREEIFPTGLPTKGYGTAIPHADIEHTLKPGIAIGILKEPIKFGQLGDPDTKIDVSIVFLLSVTQPSAQVYLLQSLVEIYKDEDLLHKLHMASDPITIVDEVNDALQKVQTPSE